MARRDDFDSLLPLPPPPPPPNEIVVVETEGSGDDDAVIPWPIVDVWSSVCVPIPGITKCAVDGDEEDEEEEEEEEEDACGGLKGTS